MNTPNKPKKLNKQRWIALAVVTVFLISFTVACKVIYDAFQNSEFFSQADKAFGDQHLKTSVALVELHKLRTGKYPQSLSDIKFIGQWDIMALGSVRYACAEDGNSYYIEVASGWPPISEPPSLDIPDGFWKGLGYDESLKHLVVQGSSDSRQDVAKLASNLEKIRDAEKVMVIEGEQLNSLGNGGTAADLLRSLPAPQKDEETSSDDGL